MEISSQSLKIMIHLSIRVNLYLLLIFLIFILKSFILINENMTNKLNLDDNSIVEVVDVDKVKIKIINRVMHWRM